MSAPTSAEYRPVLYLLLAILAGFLLVAPKDAPPPAPPDPGDITAARFEAVRDVFAARGIRAERDTVARNTVRVYVPSGLAMTKEEAREIAAVTRSRLGANSIVYVKTETGDTIAKASALGTK